MRRRRRRFRKARPLHWIDVLALGLVVGTGVGAFVLWPDEILAAAAIPIVVVAGYLLWRRY